MFAPFLDVTFRQRIGACESKVLSPGGFHRPQAAEHLLQPGSRVIFGDGFLEAGPYPAVAEAKEEQKDQDQHHHVKTQQKRMVKGENHHAHHHHHQDGNAVQQQACQGFLQREHVKKTVGEFRAVAAVQILQAQRGDMTGVFGHHADEQPLLQALDHKYLHRLEGRGNAQAGHQDEGDHHHGPQEHTEGDRVHQGFHRDGGGQ